MFLRLGGAALVALGPAGSLVALAGCDRATSSRSGRPRNPPDGGRPRPAAELNPAGLAREVELRAEPGEVDLGPLGVHRTWLYNGRFPGPEIRVREGERLRITVENALPEPTTVHWHGLPVPNAMDGVPGVTQDPVAPGDAFVYEFVARPAGSYLYHSHAGLQLDRGLIGPLVVEESTPHVDYDREYTLVLDDFATEAPRLIRGSGMMGGGDRGPTYAAFLVNGRPPADPAVFTVARGERVRLRLMNLASQIPFRVALAGHRLTITHADGRPVEPVAVDSLLIGPGERYDAVLDANHPGAWNLVAESAELQRGAARAVVRYREAREPAPPEGRAPDGLRRGRRLRPSDLISVEGTGEAVGPPDRTVGLTLSGGMMMRSAWTIDGQAFPEADPLEIRAGERVRVELMNHSMMLHPMHLHGHFFRVGRAVKDTVLVPPHMGRVAFEFSADNPGRWFFHCHNLYHMESGMARVFRYG